MPSMFRFAAAFAAALALAGCSSEPVRRAPPAPPVGAGQPALTGIAACDRYLGSYLACHRSARTFAPGTLEQHYQDMRGSLLQEAQDPQVRPQLAGRCRMLASQLQAALRGASCGA